MAREEGIVKNHLPFESARVMSKVGGFPKKHRHFHLPQPGQTGATTGELSKSSEQEREQLDTRKSYMEQIY